MALFFIDPLILRQTCFTLYLEMFVAWVFLYFLYFNLLFHSLMKKLGISADIHQISVYVLIISFVVCHS